MVLEKVRQTQRAVSFPVETQEENCQETHYISESFHVPITRNQNRVTRKEPRRRNVNSTIIILGMISKGNADRSNIMTSERFDNAQKGHNGNPRNNSQKNKNYPVETRA